MWNKGPQINATEFHSNWRWGARPGVCNFAGLQVFNAAKRHSVSAVARIAISLLVVAGPRGEKFAQRGRTAVGLQAHEAGQPRLGNNSLRPRKR